eukprot:3744219-Pyramimonas_sp.AAC.1
MDRVPTGATKRARGVPKLMTMGGPQEEKREKAGRHLPTATHLGKPEKMVGDADDETMMMLMMTMVMMMSRVMMM